MKKGVIVLLVLFALLLTSSLSSAQTAEDKVNSIITFAEDYEIGKISYLQMRIHSAVIREEVRALAGSEGMIEVDGRKEPAGLTQEKVAELFGKPTEITNWVWLVNDQKEMRIDDPMPRWEKIIFDGKKIQITFNGWPQIVKLADGSLKKYYWVDFDIKFKKKFDFDLQNAISEVTVIGQLFKETGQGASTLAQKMADSRNKLQGYLQQNQGDCLGVLGQFFDESAKKEQQILRWTATLAKDEYGELILETSVCESCEWPWADFWYRLEQRGKGKSKLKMPEMTDYQFDKRMYETKTVDELEAMLTSKFQELIGAANNLDGEGAQRFSQIFSELRGINQALGEAYNWNQQLISQNLERRKTLMKALMSQLQGSTEELTKEARFERRLVTDSAEMKNVHCREIKKLFCIQGCQNGMCIGDSGVEMVENAQPEQVKKEAEVWKQFEQYDQELRERCPEGFMVQEGHCIQIISRSPDQLITTGEGCTLESDCSGPNDICSNGACKELPREVVEIPEEQIDLNIPEQPAEEQFSEEFMMPPQGDPGMPPQEGPSEVPQQEPSEPSQPEAPAAPSEPLTEGAFLLIDLITGFFTAEENVTTGEPVELEEQNTTETVEDTWPKSQMEQQNQPQQGPEGQEWQSQGPFGMPQPQGPCPGGCNANQYCNEGKGWCECTAGFNDCDGDWINGCEATIRCPACEADSQCAQPRCEQDGNVLITFGCYEEQEGWTEERGAIAFSGGCNFRPTGKVDSYMGFDAWGQTFEKVGEMARRMEMNDRNWCIFELENLAKERKELEKSMNQDFLRWFFEDYVSKDTENWDKHMSGIFDIYWKFVDNSRRTAENLKCLQMEGFPDAYVPLNPIEYESPLGHVRFWEEKTYVDEFRMEVLSPYMQIWIFPPKEFMKQQMKTAAKEGRMPGPPEEQQQGPTPAEIAQIKQNPEMMQYITGLSEKYGGSADALITISDNGESVFNIAMTVNPDVIFDVKPVAEYAGQPDVKVTIDFNFVYDIISAAEKTMRTERPPWDQKFRMGDVVRQVVTQAKIITKIIGAITTGDIKVEPMSALPDVLSFMRMTAMQGPPGAKQQVEQ